MNNKCEWKGGRFTGCCDRIVLRDSTIYTFVKYNNKTIPTEMSFCNYCPFCGADIRKPEQSTHEETLKKIKSELFHDVDLKIIGIKQDIIFQINKLYDLLVLDIPNQDTHA